MTLELMKEENTPLSRRKCIECKEYHMLPVGDYDICVECYFKLIDKMEDETGVRRGHTK